MSRRPGCDEVAVVIPSRNRWPLLRTAIASALAQERVDVHVLVVDDGSTDLTPSELAALDESRLSVLRDDRPQGVSAARNRGLAHVTAPWVAFLDDDDVWAPGHLAAMFDALHASGVDPAEVGVVFSGNLVLDRNRYVTDVAPAAPVDDVRASLRTRNLVGGPSRVMARTDAVRAVGAFEVGFSITADWDLWLRIVPEREVVRSPELLVGYMHHDGNMHRDGKRLLAELAALQAKHRWKPARRGAGLFSNALPYYVAWTYRMGGQRFRAARWYVRSFRSQGTRRDLARAVSALLGERLTELSGLRERTTVDPSLGGWLEQVREAERDTTTALPTLLDVRGGSHVAP
jgi:glycosyltransferase involved in cell wall biosynthesis